MKRILAATFLTLTISAVNAQENTQPVAINYTADTQMIDVDELNARMEVDYRAMVTADVNLNKNQMKQIDLLNEITNDKIAEINDRYTMNDDIYSNRVRLILEERDAKLKDILTLEQYAIYLNGNRDFQTYDTKYTSGDLKIKKDADGDIKVKDSDGKIKIDDDEIIIKNELTGQKTKISPDEIKYKNSTNNRNVEIEHDEVQVKTDNKKVEIEDDEAQIKTDETNIKIDDVETKEEKDAKKKKK